jgi:hypothetical protein
MESKREDVLELLQVILFLYIYKEAISMRCHNNVNYK